MTLVMPAGACASAHAVTVPVWCLAGVLTPDVAAPAVNPEMVMVADLVPWLTTAGDLTSISAASAAVNADTVVATDPAPALAAPALAAPALALAAALPVLAPPSVPDIVWRVAVACGGRATPGWASRQVRRSSEVPVSAAARAVARGCHDA